MMKHKRNLGMVLGATALALIAGGAHAGESNLDRFTISGDAAKTAKSSVEISLDTARRIIDVCLDYARQRNRPVSVFILEPSGQIVASARMDGQGPVNIETALMKARSALYMRDSTRAWSNRLYNNLETEVRWLPIGQYWVPGGLPIVVDDQLIGSIGVGGANMDEECAYAGLTQILGPQPPLSDVLPPLPKPPLPAPIPHPQ